jgi:hypothetical protein
MESGRSAGAFPSKVTVPVIVEAASATPGQTDTATSTAASRNPYPVPRMLGSFVIANLVSVVTVDDAYRPLCGMGRLYNEPIACATPHNLVRLPVRGTGPDVPQTFSNASDSASRGSRSGTSA